MKKLLIILFTAISLFSFSQSPQRFPGGVIGKYFQKSGSSVDSVLLGDGSTKAIKDIQGSVSGGGYAANLYPTTISSDIAGYYKLSYTNETTQTIRSYTVTNQELKVNTSIYDSGIGVTTIDAGIWFARMRMYVSSASGNTHSRAEVFLRHTDGTETTLFSASSTDINNTAADWVMSESNQPALSCLATDRLGIRHYISTDSHSAITVYVVIGNGYASYINTPIALRHSQLRDLNGDAGYQHVTTTQIANWNLKEPIITSGTTSQYWRGDKTFQVLDKVAVGLSNVDNTSDLNKPVSTATQTALNLKEDKANKNIANGYAGLDSGGKVPISLLPSTLFKYIGTWDPLLNIPTLSNSMGTNGDVYQISCTPDSIEGNWFNLGQWFYNGDYLVKGNTGWEIVGSGDMVKSVNHMTGNVILTTSNISEGSNKYYTDSRSRASLSLTTTGNSGASTYNNSTGVLNIPQYTLSGLGGISLSSLSAVTPVSYNSSTGAISMPAATTSNSGYMSSSQVTSLSGKMDSIRVKSYVTGQNYLTGNQNITLSGDVTGSGTTAITTTLANSGVTAGTYKSVTVDAKGRVTSGANPTTVSGYGITDALTTGNYSSYALPLSGGNLSGGVKLTSYGTNLSIACPSNNSYARFLGTDIANGVNRAVLSANGYVSTGDNKTYQDISTIPSLFFAIDADNNKFSFKRTSSGSTSSPTEYANIDGSGNFTGNSFIKSGGTSSQFLKANGSVDATAYLPLTGGTLSGNLTAPSITLTTGAGANRVLTSDASGNASWGNVLTSGTFTPTLTNVTNTSALSYSVATYTRVGNNIHAAIKGQVTSGTGASSFTVSLPVSSSATEGILSGAAYGGQACVSLYGGTVSSNAITVGFYGVNASMNFSLSIDYIIQ